GAFDSLGWNRAQLMQALPSVLDAAARRHADRLSGQVGLFEQLGGGEALAALQTPRPETEEFPLRERLAREKELLGFYVTGHPLSDYRELIERIQCAAIDELEGVENRTRVKVAAIIAGVRNRLTRKGNERMAVLDLDDGRQTVEAVVFPRAFQECGAVIEKDLPVVVIANVDRRDEWPKLIVDSLVPLDQAEREGIEVINRAFEAQRPSGSNGPRRYRPGNGQAPVNNTPQPRALRITIDHPAATGETLERLNALFEAAPGDLPVVLAFTSDAGATTAGLLRTATRVRPDDALLNELGTVPAVLAVEKAMSEYQ
ncbi:MAG: hypothetical protein JW889_10520, partial [Verrucomicrobia bacterium]|nr:hypothetical protein [Verrucomicrobiota bacterium]